MKLKLLSAVCISLFYSHTFLTHVSADIVTFDTSQSQFDTGVNNQGFWIDNASANNVNDNYLTGQIGSNTYRSFFTFDLSSLGALDVITSASLQILRETSASGNEAFETLELFDVTTDAATLNNNQGMNAAIFSDLGSGTSYGAFPVPGSGPITDVLVFDLTSAIADMNAARGGFFSIGVSLITNDGNDFLFGNSGGADSEQNLVVEFTTIPEPANAALLGIVGISGLAVFRQRRQGSKRRP